MTVATNQFKTGMAIIVDGELCIIMEYDHVKPGKGAAFVRTKLKNVRTGAIVSKTIDGGAKFEDAFIEKKNIQYLYNSGDEYHFMDSSTYDQHAFTKEQLGDTVNYLVENGDIQGQFYNGQLIGTELPTSVVLEIKESEPGIKGDTSKAAMKPAVLETGLKVQVPLFVGPGDKIKVDTRTGEYISRA